MLAAVVLSSSLLCLLCPSGASGAMARPALGPVYPVSNNDSILNFTFIYPANFQFDRLVLNFTLYDFIDNATHDPQITPSLPGNFTNSNTSLPWIAPIAMLTPGDFIIACFQWVQFNTANQVLDDSRECVLTRAAINSTIPPIPQLQIMTQALTNSSITVGAYYPAGVPYDKLNITASLNGVVAPTTTNTTNNGTYASIAIFSFMGLVPKTSYNVCISNEYENTKIMATHRLDVRCQSISTNAVDGSAGPGSAAYGSAALVSSLLILASTLISIFI